MASRRDPEARPTLAREIEDAWKRVLALDPTDVDAMSGLIGIHRARGTLESAAAFLEGLIRGGVSAKLDPARRMLAALCEELGQLDRAVAILEEARGADPADAETLRALDRVHRARGDHAALLAVIEARLVHDGELDRTVAILRVARILDEELCDPARAAMRLAEHLRRRPDVPEAYFMHARLETKLRRFDDAIATLERAIEFLSDLDARAEASASIGRIAMMRGDPEQARHHYKRAVMLGSKSPEVISALSDSAAAAGDLLEAIAAQRLVLSTIPPQDPEARGASLVRLAELMASIGDPRGVNEADEHPPAEPRSVRSRVVRPCRSPPAES